MYVCCVLLFILINILYLGLQVSGEFKLLILHTNDMHSRFEQTNYKSQDCEPEDAEINRSVYLNNVLFILKIKWFIIINVKYCKYSINKNSNFVVVKSVSLQTVKLRSWIRFPVMGTHDQFKLYAKKAYIKN